MRLYTREIPYIGYTGGNSTGLEIYIGSTKVTHRRKHNLVVQHKEAVRLYCTRVTKEVPRN